VRKPKPKSTAAGFEPVVICSRSTDYSFLNLSAFSLFMQMYMSLSEVIIRLPSEMIVKFVEVYSCNSMIVHFDQGEKKRKEMENNLTVTQCMGGA
jgi:hypothetical protein